MHTAVPHSACYCWVGPVSEEDLPAGGGSYEGGPTLLTCISADAAGAMVPANRE